MLLCCWPFPGVGSGEPIDILPEGLLLSLGRGQLLFCCWQSSAVIASQGHCSWLGGWEVPPQSHCLPGVKRRQSVVLWPVKATSISGTSTEGRPAALFLVLAWHRVGQVTRALSPRSFTTLPTHHPYPLEIATFSWNPIYLLLLSVVNVGCPRAYVGKWEGKKHPQETHHLTAPWDLGSVSFLLDLIYYSVSSASNF